MAKQALGPYTESQFERIKRIYNALVNRSLPAFKIKGVKNTNPVFSGFSERTFYNVMERLKSIASEQGVEILFNHTLGRYECSKRFSLYLSLFPDEKSLVNDMAAALEWIGRLNQFAGLDDVFLKLEDRTVVAGLSKETVVQYDQNVNYSGRVWLRPLYEHIREDRQVKVSYTEFGCEPVGYTFSPYLLKEYNNRWHVYGVPDEGNRILHLALDRITAITPLPALSRRPCTIEWGDYLSDVIGFTRTEYEPLQIWKVRVWFPRANYVVTKPLHSSQEISHRTNDFIDFTYRLIWNREFEAALFELGPDAELLEPADKRAAFAEKVKTLAARYR